MGTKAIKIYVSCLFAVFIFLISSCMQKNSSKEIKIFDKLDLANLKFSEPSDNTAEHKYKVEYKDGQIASISFREGSHEFVDSVYDLDGKLYVISKGIFKHGDESNEYRTIIVPYNKYALRYWLRESNSLWEFSSIDTLTKGSFFIRRRISKSEQNICKDVKACIQRISKNEFQVSLFRDSFNVSTTKDTVIINLTQYTPSMPTPMEIAPYKIFCTNCDFYQSIRLLEKDKPYFPIVPF